MRSPFALIILDGWGHREDTGHNAIAEARTPFFDTLWKEYPHTLLDASGTEVGLPEGQIGNSEVGHMTIGAGKVIDTDLVRISKAMHNGEFASNQAIAALFDHVHKHGSTLHIMGLVSPGGVHSHSQHLSGILTAAKNASITNIAIHAFTDGRDTPPQSAASYLHDLEDVLESLGIGFIATASGRFYAMDRDNNWERVEKAERAMFEGQGTRCQGERPSAVVKTLYKEGAVDEHLEPIVFLDDTGKAYTVCNNDGVLFFNYRPDRARMFAKRIAACSPEKNLCFTTLTQYEEGTPALVAFPPMKIEATLASEVSKADLTQVHIAETEKYAHATYFLNGGKEAPYPNERHILIESRKDVPTHDLAPKMRAPEIADKAVEEIEAGTNFIFINFANADMVGHTANKQAVIEAVEELDVQLQRVIDALHAKGGVALISSDHGNAETNIDPETSERHTAHTMNTVPAILTQKGLEMKTGGLADITPTILDFLGLPKPEVMTGTSLIVEKS